MPEPRSTSSQLPALTGLRGIAALWVFFHHWNAIEFGTGNGIHAIALGFLGVDAFFMLSGFVMAHSRSGHFTPINLANYTSFLAERVVRLYPTNAVVLLGYLLVVVLLPALTVDLARQPYSVANFGVGLLLAQSWLRMGVGDWLLPAWSVSAELGAYAALPLVLFAVRQLKSSRAALLAAAAALNAFVLIVLLHGEHDSNLILRGGIVRLACEFFAGAALYRAWQLRSQWPVGWMTGAMTVLAIGAYALPRAEATFLALPALALLLLCLAQGQGLVARALALPPVLFLGRISYSLYLLHWPVLIVWHNAGGATRPFFSNVGVAFLTLIGATVLHVLVEAPSHALARRLRVRHVPATSFATI